MKKLFLFPIIFFLINFCNAKADVRESFNKKESLIKTCTWDNAQFNMVNYDGSTDFKTRICVDNNEGTFLVITREMDKTDLDRSFGFLRQKELYGMEWGLYYKGFIQQWSIAGDSLFEYLCFTFTKNSTSCETDIHKFLRGRKR